MYAKIKHLSGIIDTIRKSIDIKPNKSKVWKRFSKQTGVADQGAYVLLLFEFYSTLTLMINNYFLK